MQLLLITKKHLINYQKNCKQKFKLEYINNNNLSDRERIRATIKLQFRLRKKMPEASEAPYLKVLNSDFEQYFLNPHLQNHSFNSDIILGPCRPMSH